MLSAVQLGMLAALIVLFVPMGLAGWHLSRNKVLFFSGALFITLAVFVHLTPYFPNMHHFISALSAVSSLSDNCISFLHDVVFNIQQNYDFNGQENNKFNVQGKNDFNSEENSFNALGNNVSGNVMEWRWERSRPVMACEFVKVERKDVGVLLNGSWVVVIGDSQARLVVLELLRLIVESEVMEGIKRDLFKRHSDYKVEVGRIGVKVEFMWAPFISNVTEVLKGFGEERKYPDVLVMGSGLWDMLHVTDSEVYGSSLGVLRKYVVDLLGVEDGRNGPVTGSVSMESPHLFWLGMPTLINSKLNTEEKRKKMSGAMQDAYDRELYGSRLLRQSGGPLLLLDIKALSGKCGILCTEDGMHYHECVYEAAVQILLNALLIDSQQKL